MNIRNANIEAFSYDLPEDKIARYPLQERDQSKLLIWNNEHISEDRFYELPSYLAAGDLLVYNATRVIHARIPFTKATGALIEIFCLEPLNPSTYEEVFRQVNACTWKCMIGNRKKWKTGPLWKSFEENGRQKYLRVEAEHKDGEDDKDAIHFCWEGHLTFGELIQQIGIIPIPPYLGRHTEAIDQTRYQTVYSRYEGSVAAPTAGLHFTPRIFRDLEKKNIASAEITLHVGAGTFVPVKTYDVREHRMHTEYFAVSRNTIEQLIHHPSARIIPVGTTSLRTLESLYWIGYRLKKYGRFDSLVTQWGPYDEEPDLSRSVVLESLLAYMQEQGEEVLYGATQLMIVPGFQFQLTGGLITNFHQPRSTLLMLVAAFVGNNNWRRIYDYALNHRFRFLSYGDSSLLLPNGRNNS